MLSLNNKLRQIHPQDFLGKSCKVIEFDNKFDLLEFLKKNPAEAESIGYTKKFYDDLKSYTPNETDVTRIKKEVLNNLLKRGIITGSVYEGFKYSYEGEIIDYAKLASGDPMCHMQPIKVYDKWFYELYVNMSIPATVDEDVITLGAIRLIETIKALESIDIEIKINVIDYSKNLYYDEDVDDLLVIIPLISHLEHKNYKNIMPYITANFLRGPSFTISRNSVENKDNITPSLGQAYVLPNAVNLWELKEDSEIELATRIMKELGITDV